MTGEARAEGAGLGAAGAGLDARAVVRREGFVLDARVVASPGEVVAVMGPSGAGKSTLLAVVSGLLRTREGYVRVGGRDVSTPTTQVSPARRGTVLLGQDPRLFPHLTARDNIAFGLRARGRAGRAPVRAEADAWLDRVGLAAYGDRRPGTLSGGQQQRVALARALATRPRVLLLDEPLAGLDPETAADIRVVLGAQLAATGTTALFVTHAVVDAVALAARLMFLEDGRVVQQGAPRDVLAAPATAFAATVAGVGRVSGTVRAGVWRAGGMTLPAPALADGAAVAFVPPGAVRIAAGRAGGSGGSVRDVGSGGRASGGRASVDRASVDRAVWMTHVARLEATVTGVRVLTADPVVALDLPAAELAARPLAAGDPLTLEVDPRAVRIAPGPAPG